MPFFILAIRIWKQFSSWKLNNWPSGIRLCSNNFFSVYSYPMDKTLQTNRKKKSYIKLQELNAFTYKQIILEHLQFICSSQYHFWRFNQKRFGRPKDLFLCLNHRVVMTLKQYLSCMTNWASVLVGQNMMKWTLLIEITIYLFLLSGEIHHSECWLDTKLSWWVRSANRKKKISFFLHRQVFFECVIRQNIIMARAPRSPCLFHTLGWL